MRVTRELDEIEKAVFRQQYLMGAALGHDGLTDGGHLPGECTVCDYVRSVARDQQSDTLLGTPPAGDHPNCPSIFGADHKET